MRAVGALLAFYFGTMGLTFIPGFLDIVPGMVTPGDPDVRVSAGPGLTGETLDAAVDDGCHRIPLWLRPISNYPDKTRLLVDETGTEGAYILVRCSDKSIVRSNIPGMTN